MRNRVHTAALPALCMIVPAAAADTLTDGTFNPADWQSTLIAVENNGGSFIASQQPSGGNPSQCHRVQQSIPSAPAGENSGIAVLHAAILFTHDPGADGPIGHLNMSIDVNKVTSSQSIRFALVQDGIPYVSIGATTVNQLPAGWNPFELGALQAQDFQRRMPDRTFDPATPDFTSGGAAITFGYETSNATGIGAGGYTATAEFDNFTITIVAPPVCPGDLDGDDDTDVLDFALFAGAFGSSLGDPEFIPEADLDDSNTIDVLDFALFVADFGCPN